MVLLVDDEEVVRRMLAYTLEEAGISVVEASNGAAALQLVHRLNGAVSLVVTDINMPVMGGLELAQALHASYPRLPLLFITGHDPALVSDAGLHVHVLSKPFGPDDFVAAVVPLITRPEAPVRPAPSLRSRGSSQISRR